MAVNYMGYLMNLEGREVKVNRGGPDALTGTLLGIQSDYMVLSTDQGTVYINTAHVKSFSEASNNGSESNKSGGSKSGGNKSGGSKSGSIRSTDNVVYASSFNDLLYRLRHNFVQINRNGPEKVEGFVADINNGQLLLVNKDEVIRIPLFHIKSISMARKNSNNSNSNNSNSSNNNNSKSSGNKSSSNRSSGSQSRSTSGSKRDNRRSDHKSGSSKKSGSRTKSEVRNLIAKRVAAVKKMKMSKPSHK